jgi:hypothetical protein
LSTAAGDVSSKRESTAAVAKATSERRNPGRRLLMVES